MPLTTADAPGNSAFAACDVCGRTDSFAGYAAVPGAAVSIGWCHECLQRQCQPMFAIEALVCDLHSEAPEKDKDLAESVAMWKQRGVNPTLDLADWFLEQYTYTEGEYIRIRELLLSLWNDAANELESGS